MFNILTDLSLIISAMLIILWILSDRRPFEFNHDHRRVLLGNSYLYSYCSIDVNSGGLRISLNREVEFGALGIADASNGARDDGRWFFDNRGYPDVAHDIGHQRFGMGWAFLDTGKTNPSMVVFQLVVPIGALAFAFAALPLIRGLAYFHRTRRLRQHICISCGYDLRATPKQCPECGCIPAMTPK